MITLITGVPGAGKTLNTIKWVSENYGDDRQIYYRGIAGLTLDWVELSDEEAKEWYTLPKGAVIVIDEAHQVWPMRSPSAKLPEGVSRMDTHRHGGYDIFLITQMPKRLDFQARSYVGLHHHYERAFGWESTRRMEWQECVDDPKDYHRRQEAQISRVNFDKKYYEKYKSAEVHTVKKRVPKKAIWLLGAVAFTATAAVIAYDSVTSRSEMPEETRETEEFDSTQWEPISVGSPPGQTSDSFDISYSQRWTPRIPDVPWSAPAYDELTTVKSYPRPQCVHFEVKDVCQCYTQQATPLEISYPSCMQIVHGGYFNPFIEDSALEPAAGGAEAQPAHQRGPHTDDSPVQAAQSRYGIVDARQG